MILEIARKLRTKLTGNATLVLLTGGMYLRRAPQKHTYPYITYFPVSEMPFHMQTGVVEDQMWQFSIWDISINSLGSIHQEVKNTLDNQTLGLSTIQDVLVLRQGASPLSVELVEEIGNVYHQAEDYQVIACNPD